MPRNEAIPAVEFIQLVGTTQQDFDEQQIDGDSSAVDRPGISEYPGKSKLAVITLALCLAIFLVALVSMQADEAKPSAIITTIPGRTTPSSPRRFPALPNTLAQSKISHGMSVPTCSRPAPSSSSTASCTRSTLSNGSILQPYSYSRSDPLYAVQRLLLLP